MIYLESGLHQNTEWHAMAECAVVKQGDEFVP